jgi:hypothetical protein
VISKNYLCVFCCHGVASELKILILLGVDDPGYQGQRDSDLHRRRANLSPAVDCGESKAPAETESH